MLLGMKAEDVSALAFGFGDEVQHKKSGVTIAAFGGEHSAGTKDARLRDE